MENNSFKFQMERLTRHFGAKAFSIERINLILEEVKNISEKDFMEIVSDFIADSKFPPTRKDFRDAASSRRNTSYEVYKKASASDARKLTPENYQAGMKVLKGVMEGKFTNDQISKWANSSKSHQIGCKYCDSSGLIFAKEKDSKYDNYTFKCMCPEGKGHVEIYPQWSANFSERFALM